MCDTAFVRPADANQLCADPGKALAKLGWKPKTSFEELVGLMVESDLELLSTPDGRRSPSFSSDVW